MVACMKPDTGRVVALCAPGLLSREGAEGKFRRRFVEANLVDAVINLPPKLLPGLDHGAAILLLRMRKRDDTVLFVDGGGIPRTIGAEETIGRIVHAVAARVDVEGFAHLADMRKIEDCAFNLGVARYVKNRQEQQPPSLEAIVRERRAIEAGRRELHRQLAPHLSFLGMADLNPRVQPGRRRGTGMRAAGQQGWSVPPETATKILAAWHAAEAEAMALLEKRRAAAAALRHYVAGLERGEAPCGQAGPDASQRARRALHHARALAGLWDRLAALDLRACNVLGQERRLLECKLAVAAAP